MVKSKVEIEQRTEQPKIVVKYKFNKRLQKLERHEHREEKMGRGHRTTDTVMVMDEKATKDHFNMISHQVKYISEFLEKLEEIKDKHTNREKLPYFKEIGDVLEALSWEDPKNQQGYQKAKTDIEMFAPKLEEMKKVLPAKWQVIKKPKGLMK